MSSQVDPPQLVSVVIPARNEEGFIEECLRSVRGQTYTNLEIIVVDGASTDDTAKIVERVRDEDPRVRLVENPAAITPISMNVGLANAKGPWLVRVDAHATIPPDYVARAVAHLQTGKWGGVGGRKDGIGLTSAGRAIAIVMASPFGVGNSTYHHGSAVQTVEHVPFGAYPVDLARALGGWDERLRVNQDFEFDWRIREAGHELLFDPELRIDWVCRQSTPDLWRQYLRYGRGKVQVATLHPRSVKLRHLVPPLNVAWLIAALLLLPFRPKAATAALAPYVSFVAIGSALTARKAKRGDRRHIPSAFVAMHLGWGVGFWRGVVDTIANRR